MDTAVTDNMLMVGLVARVGLAARTTFCARIAEDVTRERKRRSNTYLHCLRGMPDIFEMLVVVLFDVRIFMHSVLVVDVYIRKPLTNSAARLRRVM